jgi:hypothetical protein
MADTQVNVTPKCPVHGCSLRPESTKHYGLRWSCPTEYCTVVWWGKEHTSPADRDTRTARMLAHNAFDRLWQTGTMSRGEAYAWLQETFELSPEQAHIGLFTKEQCEDLCFVVRRWTGKGREPQRQRTKGA